MTDQPRLIEVGEAARATGVILSTVEPLNEWLVIAWNSRNRHWSHRGLYSDEHSAKKLAYDLDALWNPVLIVPVKWSPKE